MDYTREQLVEEIGAEAVERIEYSMDHPEENRVRVRRGSETAG